MPHCIPRLFVLRRDRDVTGVSGPGDVADGVQWADGSVVLRWRERPSTSVWDSLDLMLSVHGHDGATRVVWAEDEAQGRRQFIADVIEAYGVPTSMLGTETERAYLHRRIETALVNASQSATWAPEGRPEWGQVSSRLSEFVNAVMPIVSQVLEQRDRAQAAAGRAYKLADHWEAARGSAYCLVRAAGAELRDALDDSSTEEGGVVHPEPKAHVGDLRRVDDMPPAVECSAQYRKCAADPRQCIRAAQHRGDHIDEHGFHWSDTVAVYPVIDGPLRCVRGGVSSCANPDHACKVCGDCMYEHPGEGGCADGGQMPPDQGPLTGIEVRDPCTHCVGLIPRVLMADHIRQLHPNAAVGETGLHEKLRKAERAADLLADSHRRAEQAEELLRVAHDTSNKAEAERARAVQRAERAVRQRNGVAEALREALGVFREIPGLWGGEVAGYEAPHPVHPSNFKRWQTALEGLPANCQKPGGCADCPHEVEAAR